MPVSGDDDVFEDVYVAKLNQLWASRGLTVGYTKDRAALDGGLHLYSKAPGTDRTVSQTRIWFQAKGKRATTLSGANFDASREVNVKVPVDQLRYWYAAPEPVYLIVYVESRELFLAEDVRDIVDRQWDAFYQQVPKTQGEVTLKVRTTAVLDDAAIERMLRHRSMRIDGPAFRGRPLGHRFDPLRSELAPLPVATYQRLVDRVLDAHGFRTTREHPAPTVTPRTSQLRILRGAFLQTIEWQWPSGTLKGYEHHPQELRTEAPVDFVHGDCLVIIDSLGSVARFTDAESEALSQLVRVSGASRALVFVNAGEDEGFSIWRGALREFNDPRDGRDYWPIALGSLAYIVLMATLVYLELAPELSWRYRSYLY